MNAKIKIRNGEFIFFLYSFVLFITFLNFNNWGNYLLVLLLFISLFMMKKLFINSEIIFLTLYCVTYSALYIYNFGNGLLSPTVLSFLLLPIFSYYIGYAAADICLKYNIKINVIIYILAAAFFIHGLLNMISFSQSNAFSRELIDFWTQMPFKVTGQSMYYIILIGMLFYAFEAKSMSIITKLIIVIGNVLVILFSTLTSTRTPLFIMIFVFFLGVILYLYLNNANIKKIFFIILGVLALAIGAYFLYTFNVGGIKELYENSNLGQRMSTLSESYKANDPRISAQIYVLTHLLDYPLGGCKLILPINEGTLERMEYAHSLWFDTAYRVGVIPFFFITIYTIIVATNIIKLIKNRSINNNIKYLLIPIVTAVFIQYALEPIMEGLIWMFLCGCFINGYIKRISYTS